MNDKPTHSRCLHYKRKFGPVFVAEKLVILQLLFPLTQPNVLAFFSFPFFCRISSAFLGGDDYLRILEKGGNYPYFQGGAL